MTARFDPIQYKITTKDNWNTVASDYHYNWAEKQIGPFKSTTELVREAGIKPADKVLCQYALMFFPNVQKVLRSVKQIMKSGANLVLAVHGVSSEVPYFSAIMNPILTYIPDIRAEGTPT